MSFGQSLLNREIGATINTRDLVTHEEHWLNCFSNTNTLQGHQGCVNTLRWNKYGSLLASGSDDTCVRIWRDDGHCCSVFDTGHTQNVFAVEFLPNRDTIILSAAGDRMVKMHDLEKPGSSIYTWTTEGRVKRLATAPDEPFLLWSASEDGYIREYDTRTMEDRAIFGESDQSDDPIVQMKTLAICQGKSHLLAIGQDKSTVPIFDRRKMDAPLLTLMPADSRSQQFGCSTHVAFNYSGTQCVVNQSCGSILVFDMEDNGSPTVLQKLDSVIQHGDGGEKRKERKTKGAKRTKCSSQPTEATARVRAKAKELLLAQSYPEAIEVYSIALQSCQTLEDRHVLYANRGMCYLSRRWSGDTFACVRDCVEALLICPKNAKALWRLTRALTLLEQWDLAKKCLELFRKRFPNDTSINRLDETIKIAMIEHPHASTVMRDEPNVRNYNERYTANSNSKTDIQEANFFGTNDQYIVSGSDCGFLLVWDRSNGCLCGSFEADERMLNIVQPHPTKFALATSGIEKDIRIWEPVSYDLIKSAELDTDHPLIRRVNSNQVWTTSYKYNLENPWQTYGFALQELILNAMNANPLTANLR